MYMIKTTERYNYNDEYGNWKTRVKFINDVPVLYEEREYVYYK